MADETGAHFRADAEQLEDEERQAADFERQAVEARERVAARRLAGLTAEQRARLARGLDEPTVIEESGELAKIEVGANTEIEPWAFQHLEYAGTRWNYRVPKPLATMFLGVTGRRGSSSQDKLNAIIGFLEHVLSPASFLLMQDRALDHDDDFDSAEMSGLMQRVMEAGSSRPTGLT